MFILSVHAVHGAWAMVYGAGLKGELLGGSPVHQPETIQRRVFGFWVFYFLVLLERENGEWKTFDNSYYYTYYLLPLPHTHYLYPTAYSTYYLLAIHYPLFTSLLAMANVGVLACCSFLKWDEKYRRMYDKTKSYLFCIFLEEGIYHGNFLEKLKKT